jgi:hypothetical protein
MQLTSTIRLFLIHLFIPKIYKEKWFSCFCHLIFTKRNREKSFYFVFSHSCFLVFAFNFPLSRFRFVTTKSRKREMTTPGFHFSLYILGMNRWIRRNGRITQRQTIKQPSTSNNKSATTVHCTSENSQHKKIKTSYEF